VETWLGVRDYGITITCVGSPKATANDVHQGPQAWFAQLVKTPPNRR
jgi:hypothetical protein